MHQDSIHRLVFWVIDIVWVQCIIYEVYSLLKILFDIFLGCIINRYYQVLKLSWVLRLYPAAHSDNMSDFVLLKKW